MGGPANLPGCPQGAAVLISRGGGGSRGLRPSRGRIRFLPSPLAPVVAAGDLQPPSSALDAAASGDLPVLLAGPLPAPSAVLAEAPMERVRPP